MIVLLFQTMGIYRFENCDELKCGLAVWSGMPALLLLFISSSFHINTHSYGWFIYNAYYDDASFRIIRGIHHFGYEYSFIFINKLVKQLSFQIIYPPFCHSYNKTYE